MIKKFIIILISIVIICILLYFLPWKSKINTTLQGVQSRIGDENYSENISITIKGEYFDYLFKEDTFNGVILIDKYEFTLDGSWVSLNFHDNYSLLMYQDKNYLLPKGFGTICCTKDFEQVLICVGEPIGGSANGWSGDNGLFISAPSENRNQAIAIAKKLSIKSKWLSTANWY